MTSREISRACFTAGHMIHLAGVAREAGAITAEEAATVERCGQKLYSWLMSQEPTPQEEP